MAAQLGRGSISKPLLIISEGCCSLPENLFRLKRKYITVHGWLSCDFFKNDLIWLNFLGSLCWKWLQHIWQAFALCESNFLERHPHVPSAKYSFCFNLGPFRRHFLLRFERTASPHIPDYCSNSQQPDPSLMVYSLLLVYRDREIVYRDHSGILSTQHSSLFNNGSSFIFRVK